MIAQRHAKCWVLHLNDNDGDTDGRPSNCPQLPTTQCGMKGHIIIYLSNPEKLMHVLPPPMLDIITPICVLFVGSKPPSKEWLQTKAKPLYLHNPLYSDIVIDHESLNNMLLEQIAPVDITMQDPNTANQVQRSRYDFTPPASTDAPSHHSIFESVVVTDLKGRDVSSNEMAAEALRHLRNGGGFVQIRHGPHASNEYEDEC
ncbi:hypothetical protein JB92DRAFT_3081202 [Gautieria morchelliformis]|nr:hypothetical protein JB92DRAFT_3081202 [Gautieria morchelliformis]